MSRNTSNDFTRWINSKVAELGGIPNSEISQGSGLSESAVGKIRRGERTPGVESIVKLANFFGGDPAALIAMVYPEVPLDFARMNPEALMLLLRWDDLSEEGKLLIRTLIEHSGGNNNSRKFNKNT